ncbi:GntR family transcriptional regulator [Planococcus sp. APC 4015]|nr:GntR family transcriptional regulator [Planococcus sp. APC 4015]
MATPLSPLDPRGAVLGDEVYATLSEAILDGTLPPGERLRDQDLAERLGVSRTPVREALQRLERSGLVEVSPNRYTRVSIPSEKLTADTEEFVMYTLGSCMRIALDRGSDDAVDVAIASMDAVIAASRADDHVSMRESSIGFFEHVVTATGNTAFLTMMREAEMAIRRNLAQWHPAIECPLRRTETYERLRGAMRARDGALAEALVRELLGFS